MAQAQPEERIEDEIQQKEMMNSTSSSGFRFNVQAPEFVPRSHTTTTTTQVPFSGYYYPCFHYLGGTTAASDWIFVGDQEPVYVLSNPNVALPSNSKNVLTDDLRQKIVKQVC